MCIRDAHSGHFTCVHSIVVLFEYAAAIYFSQDKMLTPLRFTDTQSHHAAVQKEKQLQSMRAAFGLDGDNVRKKDGL